MASTVASIRRLMVAASEAARPTWDRLDADRRRYLAAVLGNLASLHSVAANEEGGARDARLAGAFLIAIDVLMSAVPTARANWEAVDGHDRSCVCQTLKAIGAELQTRTVEHEALRMLGEETSRAAVDGGYADAVAAAVALLGGRRAT